MSRVEDININDLLNRPPLEIDSSIAKSYLENQKILITGGCGSIGSEIVRQLLNISANNVTIYDNSECGMFNSENEIKTKYENANVSFYLGDVNNLIRLNDVFNIIQPDIVFHCAAYKHVVIMENNPNESIRVNIVGSKNVADVSLKYNVKKFIMISTDKAVNPTNVMGASKRIAELYINHLNKFNTTQFITTRFGNVLGSSGSVVPAFLKRINDGNPIQITHPEIVRYFMTIPEAAQLVLQAATIGNGGEILLFDMGSPVKIVDLAKNMIKLYATKNIPIEFINLRPGEKLYEELLCNGENTIPTKNKQIMKLKHNVMYCDNFTDTFNELINTYFTDVVELKLKLKKLVPEYIIA
jgi:FlaA1/EpsC-like NDP-sugar epimerase